jgi:hypothetical protein
MQVPVAAPGQYGYTEVQDQTYLGETFWKSVPPREQHESAPWNREDAPDEEAHIGLVSLNHMALGVHDVQTMTRLECGLSGLHSPAQYFKDTSTSSGVLCLDQLTTWLHPV